MILNTDENIIDHSNGEYDMRKKRRITQLDPSRGLFLSAKLQLKRGIYEPITGHSRVLAGKHARQDQLVHNMVRFKKLFGQASEVRIFNYNKLYSYLYYA